MFLRNALAVVLGAFLLSTVACGTDGAASDPAAEGEGQEAEWAPEVRAKTDAQVKAEVEAAAVDNLYVSESDYPFTWVEAKLEGQKTMTQTLVREKLASYVDNDADADKPMSSLVAMDESWTEWKKNSVDCEEDAYPGPEECAKMTKMNAALEKNLRSIKVFYFGSRGRAGMVDGTAVTIFIVGRTPQGNLAGVKTIAIWT